MSQITCRSYFKLMCIANIFLSFSLSSLLLFLSLSFIFLFYFLKGSISKSNTVSLSMRQLQSPALWSGPSILSPTSWLFKRAKAQQCSFLNTQIHPSTNRGTAVWQKSLSLSLSLSLPLFFSLSCSCSHSLTLSFPTLDSDTLPPLITHPPP